MTPPDFIQEETDVERKRKTLQSEKERTLHKKLTEHEEEGDAHVMINDTEG